MSIVRFCAFALTTGWVVGCAPPASQPLPGEGSSFVVEQPLATVRGTLFVPTDASGVAVKEQLPWVVVIPAFASVASSYTQTARALSRHGFVVTALEHDFGFASALRCETQREGFLRIASSMRTLRDENRGEGIRTVSTTHPAGLIADDRYAVVGHSYGGKLALWTAVDVEGAVAAVGLDPVDGGGDERRPAYCGDDPEGFAPIADRLDTLDEETPTVLVSAGLAGDCAPADGNAAVLFAAGRGPRALLRIPGAAHTDFIDVAGPDCGVACDLCPASEVEADDVRDLSLASMLALFGARLIDNAPASEAVTRAVSAAEALAPDDGFVEVEQAAGAP